MDEIKELMQRLDRIEKQLTEGLKGSQKQSEETATATSVATVEELETILNNYKQ